MKAQISNSSGKISKSKGDIIVVNLGDGFPISTAKCTIVSWILYVNGEPIPGSGNMISNMQLKSAKIGKKVFLEVKYKMNGSKTIKETETSYKVVI